MTNKAKENLWTVLGVLFLVLVLAAFLVFLHFDN